MKGFNPRDLAIKNSIASLEQFCILALTDFIYEIISCAFSSTYCFISIVVGTPKTSNADNAESINEYFCFSVKLLKHSRKIFGYTEAYSAAGETWFGWWLVEHYLPYHVNRPDGCGLGEPARGG